MLRKSKENLYFFLAILYNYYGGNMLKEGQIVKLSDNKEYIVIKKINAHSFNYVCFITSDTPLEILIGTEKMVDGTLEIDEVKDNTELDYVLSLLKSL